MMEIGKADRVSKELGIDSIYISRCGWFPMFRVQPLRKSYATTLIFSADFIAFNVQREHIYGTSICGYRNEEYTRFSGAAT